MENQDKRRCMSCDEEKSLSAFRCRMSPATELPMIDNICRRCKSSADAARLKLQLIDAFGGKCQCCGESHPCFLTLEHIVPVRHAKQTRQCVQLLRDARRDGWDPTKYELLCMNCNMATGLFGKCPHRAQVTPEQERERLQVVAEGGKIGYDHRKTSGEFKPGPDERRTDGQFKDGHEYIGPKKSEQVVQ
jgi:hypothetical protein